jgi:superfamily II DNA helicase RecQ
LDEIELNSINPENRKDDHVLYSEITKLKYSLIYICPERLGLGLESSPAEQEFLQVLIKLDEKGMLKRFILDEVHCVKTWGDTFRKDYSLLKNLKKLFPKVPVLGLTATASVEMKV